jgi:hypothetical protein
LEAMHFHLSETFPGLETSRLLIFISWFALKAKVSYIGSISDIGSAAQLLNLETISNIGKMTRTEVVLHTGSQCTTLSQLFTHSTYVSFERIFRFVAQTKFETHLLISIRNKTIRNLFFVYRHIIFKWYSVSHYSWIGD